MTSDEHQINLFARYEQRLLSGDNSKPQVIPAVVITGFLGSGKTTLVQHILRNRGSLRIAVLINEVGQVDVDSELVNAKQGNAALGLTASDLSGGCICCSRAEDLAAALRRLRSPAPAGPGAAAASGGHTPCDYLLVETSGAADAGPLAEALVAAGFRLDAVVAVVDAEAGREALRHPVATAQVCCADVVVLNKCDLMAPGGLGDGGGLGALADLEDELAGMAPGVRVVRARYGEVPLTAVLDVEPVGPSPAAGAMVGGGAAAGPGGGDVRALVAEGAGAGAGFMSHESVPSASSSGGYRLASGPLTADGLTVGSSRHSKRRGPPHPPHAPIDSSSPQGGTAAPTSHDHNHNHQRHDHHHHSHHDHNHAQGTNPGGAPPRGPGPDHSGLHTGFHTESVAATDGPCSLDAFADFVVRRLVREPALLRSKGVMWFAERREHRFTFHLSGRRRVECSREGPWEGPAGTQLVLIGTDAEAVRRLRDQFVAEVLQAPARAAAGVEPEVDWSVAAAATEEGAAGAEPAGEDAAAAVAAAAAPGLLAVEEVAAQIAAHERLELLPAGPRSGAVGEGGSAPRDNTSKGGSGSGDTSVAVATASGGSAEVHGSEETDGARAVAPPLPPPPPGAVVAVARQGAATGQTGGAGVVHFTTRGSALHGINSEDLNAELLRRANATGRMMLVAVTAPGKISAVTNVQSRDRVLSLLLPVAGERQAARDQVRLLLEAADPILRKAYSHVHNCKCDVASAMQAARD